MRGEPGDVRQVFYLINRLVSECYNVSLWPPSQYLLHLLSLCIAITGRVRLSQSQAVPSSHFPPSGGRLCLPRRGGQRNLADCLPSFVHICKFPFFLL